MGLWFVIYPKIQILFYTVRSFSTLQLNLCVKGYTLVRDFILKDTLKMSKLQ